jgi:hypothetical protein
MRIASVILSLLLHVGLALAALWSMAELGRAPLPDKAYIVDLVRLARPAPPRPVAPAPAAPAPAAPSRARAAPAPAAPAPAAAPHAPPAALHRPRPASASAAAPPPGPEAPAPPRRLRRRAGVSLAAPRPRRARPTGLREEDPTRALAQASAVQSGDTTHVAGLHGFAAFADTFALDACGADTYVPEDYFGHYAVGRDRVVSVIDGREAYDAFLFYDARTGLHRKLTRRGEMIFTYGPAFDQAEPVVGSVTILPKKDRYEDKRILLPAQLVWLPDVPPMQYGTRVEFTRAGVAVEAPGGELAGTLVLVPEREPVPGVVLLHCADCAGPERMLGFAQALALHGLAVLVYEGRGCGPGQGGAVSPGERAADALAALRTLRAQPGVDGARVGLWGQGAGGSGGAGGLGQRGAGFLVLAHLPRSRPGPGPAQDLGQSRFRRCCFSRGPSPRRCGPGTWTPPGAPGRRGPGSSPCACCPTLPRAATPTPRASSRRACAWGARPGPGSAARAAASGRLENVFSRAALKGCGNAKKDPNPRVPGQTRGLGSFERCGD